MNYLAHSFLSFSEEQLVGNMIADFIKNRDLNTLPKGIQEGVRLHRAIDTFTDTHPVIHHAKKIFSPVVRLYSGAFVDVSFDYFLANDLGIKSEQEWAEYSQKVYQTLQKYDEFLPDSFKLIFQKMKRDDWLYNYRYDWGIEFSFQNVVNKAKYLEKGIDVFPLFLDNKTQLQQFYNEFFSEIREYCHSSKLKV